MQRFNLLTIFCCVLTAFPVVVMAYVLWPF
jgi:hypothetical protein